MRYLFKYWDNLRKALTHSYLMLFLDYDGTLTPIVDKPNMANLSVRSKKLLKKLSKNCGCKLAIISGRALSEIKRMIGIKNIIYVGNHGLEIYGPKIKFINLTPLPYRAILKVIKNDLNRKISLIKNAFVEDKGFSLSLHYRLVNKRDVPWLKNTFHETLRFYVVNKKIKIKTGKKVFEIRPPRLWDKGKAALWLLGQEDRLEKGKEILPIYIGDDKTDEDAFKALKNKGLTITVGRSTSSGAKYYLKDTKEVIMFLNRILKLKEGMDICPN